MTVYEAAKRHDPDGNVAKIAEVLEKKNTVWKDMHVKPANDTHSHVVTIRVEEGEATTRQINAGANEIESEVGQKREEIMLLENFLVLDEQTVEREGANAKKFRQGELKGCLGGYIKGFHRNYWYGGGAKIGEVTGLSNRFNKLSMGNVLTAGGAGNDLSSLWIVEPGDDGENFYLTYPKSANGCGIEEEDLGKIMWADKNNKKFRAYVNQIKLQFGMSIPQEKAVIRLANIESDFSVTSKNLRDEAVINMLIASLRQLPGGGEGAIIYGNGELLGQMDIMAFHKYGGFRHELIMGKQVTMFMQSPCRVQNSLVPTESAIA